MKSSISIIAMKKLFKLSLIVAAAAASIASCQKQETEIEALEDVKYTFLIGNADETKATIGETCVVWDEGDQIGTFASGATNNYSTVTPATAETPASFSIYSKGGLTVDSKVYCYYPYASGSVTSDNVPMSIPTSQTEKNSMPMASAPYTVVQASQVNNTDYYSGEIFFYNLGSVIEFNIYSTTVDYQSENVLSVEFQAEDAIAGSFNFNLTTVDENNLTISGYAERTVTSSPSTPIQVGADKENAAKVKMVVAPGTHGGTIVVTTDRATYTYSMSEREFGRSRMKPLGINLKIENRVEPDYSGTYAILAEKSSSYYYLTNVDNGASTKRLNSEEVNSLPDQNATLDASMAWNVIKNNDGTYYIQSVENNYYLDHTSENSAVLTENIGDAVALTILKEDEKYSISYKDSNSEIRNFVKNISASYFAFYTSEQCGNVHLVPVNAAFIPQIIISSDTEQSVAATGGDVVFNYTLKNLGDLTTVTAIEESVFLDVNVDVEDNTVTVTVSENKTPNERSAQVTLTCGEATPVVLTITQLGASSDVWELVTGAASISVGDKIVIVAKDFNYALSTTQNNNNRGQAVVTKNTNTVSFGSDVQIMTVEEGIVDGTFAFNTGDGYLYAASSSSNYLKTRGTINENASWSITVENEVAKIVAQGTNTRNMLQYNNTSSLFSCYAEDKPQASISIYKLVN